MNTGFSEKEKLRILKRINKGVSISLAAKENSISRTTLYNWQRENEKKKKNSGIKPKPKQQSFFGRKHNQTVSEAIKREMLDKYRRGESITRLCEAYGVSRTWFYNLLKESKTSLLGSNSKSSASDYSSTNNHYRFNPWVDQAVIDIVRQKPHSSVRQIVHAIEAKYHVKVSIFRVYTALKRFGITRQEARLAYLAKQINRDKLEVNIPATIDTPPNKRLPRPFKAVTFGIVSLSAILIIIYLVIRTEGVNKSIWLYKPDVRNISLANSDISPKPSREEVISSQSSIQSSVKFQDPEWGILAVNVNKSSFTIGEKSLITVGILDKAGQTVCEAKVGVAVTDPENVQISLDNQVIKNSLCLNGGKISDADYTVSFLPTKLGLYHTTVIASTPTGSHTVTAAFLVKKALPFTVERIAPSRTWPLATYTMKLKVHVEENFAGILEETVPSDLSIVPENDFYILHAHGQQILQWKLSMSKGEDKELVYTFDTPHRSPAYYLLGGLSLKDILGITVFTDDVPWQLAVDSVN